MYVTFEVGVYFETHLFILLAQPCIEIVYEIDISYYII
jgi:hypothetical protein